MANTVWNTETSSPAPFYKNTYNENSKLVRLVEDPEIKKDIQFDELSLDFSIGSADNGGHKLQTIGNMYPVIRINDIILGKPEIRSLKISSVQFIPTIELNLKFSSTHLISTNMPKDGDIVSVYIRTNTDAINYLRNDFVITSCIANVKEKSSKNTVTIYGKMFIEGLEANNNIFGIIGTSKDVLKNVAKKFKLGFAYNDSDNMNDLQNWLCCYDTPANFVEDVTAHSWKNSTSFFKSWIDFYYNLCFVNVNKFLSSEENPEDEIDITFNSSTLALNEIVASSSSVEDATPMLKVFTNDIKFKGTPFYINKWKPVNNSGISTITGYSNEVSAFVHNQNVYKADKEDCYDIFHINPVYDMNKQDSHIILRGRAKYDETQNPDNEQKRVNYDWKNTYINHIWAGVEYRMDEKEDKNSNNSWSGNLHKNYHIAEYHNSLNDAELNKLYVQVECDGLCLQVMRGERIPVILEYNDAFDANAAANSAPATHNKFYSGYYIVDGIEYVYNGKRDDGYSPFSTIMTLKRREWPTPEEIKKDTTTNS